MDKTKAIVLREMVMQWNDSTGVVVVVDVVVENVVSVVSLVTHSGRCLSIVCVSACTLWPKLEGGIPWCVRCSKVKKGIAVVGGCR
eukprot:3169724-Amphidinium_carterae.1